jgi:hypothetical protein
MRELVLMGVREVALAYGCGSANVCMMRSRGMMPEPQWTLSSGPIWDAAVILRWIEARRAA